MVILVTSCLVRFQASAVKRIRSVLSWAIKQRVAVVPHRRFGKAHRSKYS